MVCGNVLQKGGLGGMIPRNLKFMTSETASGGVFMRPHFTSKSIDSQFMVENWGGGGGGGVGGIPWFSPSFPPPPPK